DGDPRQLVLTVDLGDRQAFDIVAAPGKQPNDAGQYTRLVVNEDGDGVSLEISHARPLKREPCPPPRPASWPRPRGRAASRCGRRRREASGSNSPPDRLRRRGSPRGRPPASRRSPHRLRPDAPPAARPHRRLPPT